MNVQIFIAVWALGPNIWGRVTDRPLFALRHSNVLPARAPVSINGRHVAKHIQHTRRTLWLEEMDWAGDWVEVGLGVGESLDVWITEGLFVLPPPPASGTDTFLFCFMCLCVWYGVFYSCLWPVFDHKLKQKKTKRSHREDEALRQCSVCARSSVESNRFYVVIGGTDMSRQPDSQCLKPQFHIWNPRELLVFPLAWTISLFSLLLFF